MRWSGILLKTLREKPRGAETPGHILLLRGGFIHPLGSGLFVYNALFKRSLDKLSAIVREEMERADCAEILMPVVQPKELWLETGRWDRFENLLLKAKNRSGQSICLGPTHEEAVTAFARSALKSFKDLPFNLYQIQTKYRDEIRPRFGLLRAREFVMKDSYSFDADKESALKHYEKMSHAYSAIFHRLNVSFVRVQAESGLMGGKKSEEFHILAERGEDALLISESGAFAANKEAVPDKKAGDKSPDGGGVLVEKRGIEAGHLFYLSDAYSRPMNLSFIDRIGQSRFAEMGCYGLGITRVLQAIAEQSHDEAGILWPLSVAPFAFHISLLDPKEAAVEEALSKAEQILSDQGLDCFIDDREERPGVKFKDADLLGAPFRLNIGKKDLPLIELIERKTGRREKFPLSALPEKAADRISADRIAAALTAYTDRV